MTNMSLENLLTIIGNNITNHYDNYRNKFYAILEIKSPKY